MRRRKDGRSLEAVLTALHVMKKVAEERFTRRLVRLLLAVGLLCLLIIGFHTYLGLGKSVSVGHFELAKRNDTQWGYQRQKVAVFSGASGARLRMGDSFSIGPFQVIHWREWKVN